MKKTMLIVFLVFAVMLLVSCSNSTDKAEDVDNTTAVSSSVGNSESNNSSVSTKNEAVSNAETKYSANEDPADNKGTATTQQKATQNNDSDTQKATKNNKTITTTKKSASAKETTTKRQTTTQKQTTTNKPTTTQKPTTTKKSSLSKSDVEWVQSQAHAYIRSKGISVDSSVQSFSYRTSSHNYTSKNDLLNTIKETIDFEYSECMSSGWNKVSMYVSISSDGNGDYWLIVKYGDRKSVV